MKKIDPNSLVFRNKDSKKNFGNKTGKEFGVYFENHCSWIVYKDGSLVSPKENDKNETLFEEVAANPNGDVYKIKFKDIKWNILDFT